MSNVLQIQLCPTPGNHCFVYMVRQVKAYLQNGEAMCPVRCRSDDRYTLSINLEQLNEKNALVDVFSSIARPFSIDSERCSACDGRDKEQHLSNDILVWLQQNNPLCFTVEVKRRSA